MGIGEIVYALAYGFVWAILLTIITNMTLFYILKKMGEKQFLFINAIILFELSILFIFGFINILLTSNYSREEKISLLLTLTVLIFILLNIGISIYKKSKNKNSENLEVGNKHVK